MQITVHNTPTQLEGKEIRLGQEAPAARVRELGGEQNVIGMIAPKVQLLLAIPSLKTEVCSLGAKKFNEMMQNYKNVTTLMVTTDDAPFLEEFLACEPLEHAKVLIDEDRQFGKKYGVLIGEGKLKNRLARAVFIVDKEGVVRYKEVVGEITDEADYTACIEALDAVLSEKKKGHVHENWMRA